MNAHPSKADYTRYKDAGKKRVIRSQPMGYERRKYSTDKRTGVDDSQEIKSKVRRRADDSFGVDGDVEIGGIEACQEEKHSQSEQGEGGFFEGSGFEQGPGFIGDGPCAEDSKTDELGCEDDEGDDAGGPAEAEGWLEPAEDDGVEDTACVSNESNFSPRISEAG